MGHQHLRCQEQWQQIFPDCIKLWRMSHKLGPMCFALIVTWTPPYMLNWSAGYMQSIFFFLFQLWQEKALYLFGLVCSSLMYNVHKFNLKILGKNFFYFIFWKNMRNMSKHFTPKGLNFIHLIFALSFMLIKNFVQNLLLPYHWYVQKFYNLQ